jgi:hypothetical protein
MGRSAQVSSVFRHHRVGFISDSAVLKPHRSWAHRAGR